jgi:hypothetical protein
VGAVQPEEQVQTYLLRQAYSQQHPAEHNIAVVVAVVVGQPTP